MEDLLKKINNTFAVFTTESAKGSLAAARRARKASLEIAALMKEYRAVSPKPTN